MGKRPRPSGSSFSAENLTDVNSSSPPRSLARDRQCACVYAHALASLPPSKRRTTSQTTASSIASHHRYPQPWMASTIPSPETPPQWLLPTRIRSPTTTMNVPASVVTRATASAATTTPVLPQTPLQYFAVSRAASPMPFAMTRPAPLCFLVTTILASTKLPSAAMRPASQPVTLAPTPTAITSLFLANTVAH